MLITLLVFQIFLLIVLFGLYIYFKHSFLYWKRRNVPFLLPKIPFGNFENPLKNLLSPGHQYALLYRNIRAKGLRNAGTFSLATPVLIVSDLDLIKNILTADFSHFDCRGTYVNRRQTISPHLIAINGPEWRMVRSKVSPLLTIGKLKLMYPFLKEVKDTLIKAVEKQLQMGKTIDMVDLTSSFTIDIIGSIGFGIDCRSFQSLRSDFKRFGAKALQPGFGQMLIDQFCFAFQNLSRQLNLKPFSKEVNEFFSNAVIDTIHYRERNNIKRNDFLQEMINLKQFDSNLSMDLLIAQCFVFFIASYDTSSTTMTFALLEMCLNEEIQVKIRREIEQVLEKYNGKISFDSLSDMEYLTQVIDETLRKHPPASLITRRCTKDYKLPNTDITIEKGIMVVIPLIGIHNDPEFFPKPDLFDPERFSKENKPNILPYTYLPFGEGPRICLGIRFAQMQMKLALAALIKNYKMSLNPSTNLPVKLKPNFLMHIDGDINIDFEKI